MSHTDIDMDMSGGSMAMTFSPISSYQTTILWSWWRVDSPAQFFFSLLSVALACVCYHYVRLVVVNLEEAIRDEIRSGAVASNDSYGIVLNGILSEGSGLSESLTADKSNGHGHGGASRARIDSGGGSSDQPSLRPAVHSMLAVFTSVCSHRGGGRGSARALPKRLQNMLLLHAFLNAFAYMLALLLMLVAMTYNSLLFIALLVGYFLGDYLFFFSLASKTTMRVALADEYSCH